MFPRSAWGKQVWSRAFEAKRQERYQKARLSKRLQTSNVPAVLAKVCSKLVGPSAFDHACYSSADHPEYSGVLGKTVAFELVVENKSETVLHTAITNWVSTVSAACETKFSKSMKSLIEKEGTHGLNVIEDCSSLYANIAALEGVEVPGHVVKMPSVLLSSSPS